MKAPSEKTSRKVWQYRWRNEDGEGSFIMTVPADADACWWEGYTAYARELDTVIFGICERSDLKPHLWTRQVPSMEGRSRQVHSTIYATDLSDARQQATTKTLQMNSGERGNTDGYQTIFVEPFPKDAVPDPVQPFGVPDE